MKKRGFELRIEEGNTYNNFTNFYLNFMVEVIILS